MSDFSGLEQTFVLSGISSAEQLRMPPGMGLPQQERSYDVVLEEVDFHRLHAVDEMHAIQKMRAEIQLPGTAVADPGFISREKKETGRGWLAHSNGMAISSAP